MRDTGRRLRRQLSLGFRLRHCRNLDDVDHNGTVFLDGQPGVALEPRFYDSSLHPSGSFRSLILRVERTKVCSRRLATDRDRGNSVLRNDNLEDGARTDSEATSIDYAVRSICGVDRAFRFAGGPT